MASDKRDRAYDFLLSFVESSPEAAAKELLLACFNILPADAFVDMAEDEFGFEDEESTEEEEEEEEEEEDCPVCSAADCGFSAKFLEPCGKPAPTNETAATPERTRDDAIRELFAGVPTPADIAFNTLHSLVNKEEHDEALSSCLVCGNYAHAGQCDIE